MDIRVFQQTEWADGAAALLRELSEEAVAQRGRVLLALSGGSTPQQLYRRLADPVSSHRCPWRHMIFFFGDERCVPPEHPESNYGMADRELFQPLGVASRQVHRMKGEHPEPAAAAREYEDDVRRVTGAAAPALPSLDVILLGLGEDGHTASLFPGTRALLDETHLVAVGHAPKGVPLRLTLTLGVINRASVILFLVTGSGKATTVRRVLEPQNDGERSLPASLVQPASGRLVWVLDEPAAEALTDRGSKKRDTA